MRLWFAKLFISLFLCQAAYAVYPLPVSAKHGMAVSAQKLASEVGAHILENGGNAIDAAVAVGYALAVVTPCCGNIGGGGFMLIHQANGKNIFLNFREKAPLAAKPNMYLDAQGKVIPGKSMYGYLASGVPGTVKGLDFALRKYGSMTRKQVMAPAIRLAEKGFVLVPGDIIMLGKGKEYFPKYAKVAAVFLNKGKPYQAGERLVQKNLAKTLKLIAKEGSAVFYKGKIAKTIVDASQKHGGIFTLADFAQYKVEELKPLQCEYRGYQIISSPPPSSGGVALCEMLNIVEAYPLKSLGFHSAESSHYLIEAMRFAFADRNNKLGDPDFVNNPVATLTSKSYAAKLRHYIKKDQSIPSRLLPFPQAESHEGVNTTHYSVVDRWGNAVAVTYTLNSFFGSYVMPGNLGFLLNAQMDDFTAKPGVGNQFGLIQGEANSIQPGKRPLSSMTPTIVMKDNKPLIVLGSPGGPWIISSILLTIINILDYGLDIQAAVDAPRFHQQWIPNRVELEEPFVFSRDTRKILEKMGYRFKKLPPWGAVEAIFIDPETQVLYGGSDNRRPAGAAVGY